MPPSAAPEWLRVGCSFEIIATSAPASKAAMAARMPAQPAPTTRTSCSSITSPHATQILQHNAPMTDLSSRFRAAINLEQSEPSTMFFYARLIEDRLAELQSDRWATSERLLDSLGAPLFRSAAPQQESVVVQQGGAL